MCKIAKRIDLVEQKKRKNFRNIQGSRNIWEVESSGIWKRKRVSFSLSRKDKLIGKWVGSTYSYFYWEIIKGKLDRKKIKYCK